MPSFLPNGYLPVGRFSCSPEDAEALLVGDPLFVASITREELWTGFERYLAEFFALEEKFQADLPGRLIDRVWLGGSFVSAKVDPRNVDATVVLNLEAKDALKGKPGAGLFTKSRDSILRKYGVSALFLNYQPVVSVFQRDELEVAEKDYLISRGAWDDWWQRARNPGEKEAPSLDTCAPRRGYLEVVL